MGKREETVRGLRPVDENVRAQTEKRLAGLTKPLGSLGRLEELAVTLAGASGKARPSLRKKVVFTLAGDHGVCEEGVSAYPQEVTGQMVKNFLAGGAAINVLAGLAGARVQVVDTGIKESIPASPGLLVLKIARGTANMAKGPAMSREEAIRSLEIGMEAVDEVLLQGMDLVGVGDMGIGNTTAASAILAALSGRDVREVTGRGTGIDSEGLEKKITVIEKALALNQPEKSDPLDVLAKVGGFEIGAIAGVALRAAYHRVPVVVDGFIAGAGALLGTRIAPALKDYLVASHVSAEAGHRILLEELALVPLLDLGMRLGEGTGAALGMILCEAAVRILNDMATFSEAGVSEES